MAAAQREDRGDRRLPDAGGAVFARGDHAFTVRREERIEDVARVAEQRDGAREVLSAPDTCRAVEGGRDDGGAIGAEPNADDLVRVLAEGSHENPAVRAINAAAVL